MLLSTTSALAVRAPPRCFDRRQLAAARSLQRQCAPPPRSSASAPLTSRSRVPAAACSRASTRTRRARYAAGHGGRLQIGRRHDDACDQRGAHRTGPQPAFPCSSPPTTQWSRRQRADHVAARRGHRQNSVGEAVRPAALQAADRRRRVHPRPRAADARRRRARRGRHAHRAGARPPAGSWRARRSRCATQTARPATPQERLARPVDGGSSGRRPTSDGTCCRSADARP